MHSYRQNHRHLFLEEAFNQHFERTREGSLETPNLFLAACAVNQFDAWTQSVHMQ